MLIGSAGGSCERVGWSAFTLVHPPSSPVQPLVLVPEGRSLPALPTLGTDDRVIEVRRVSALPHVTELPTDRPVVAFVDAVFAHRSAAYLAPLAERAALVGLGDVGEIGPSGALADAALVGWMAADAHPSVARTTLRGALRHAAALIATARASALQQSSASDLRELSRVGAALATERDLTTLLGMILTQARRLSNADAGSLYLVDQDQEGNPSTLRFKLSQNATLPDLPFSEFSIPIDHASLSGYVAATGERLMIDDAYVLPAHVTYRQNRSFDDQFGYRTKSMLVLPMFTLRNDVIGVLQLINKKRDCDVALSSTDLVAQQVIPFDQHSVDVVSALAAQAAVAIENSRLYEDIERLFEGFVTAAVTAIESRDPATSGHSFRVATLTTGLAESVDRAGEGPYKGLSFSKDQLRELRYAGLLHDFGKVGVREQVLVKQKKLYGADLALVRGRFQFLMQQVDLEYERERAEYLAAHGQRDYAQAAARLDLLRREQRDQLSRWLDAIVRANEPTILPEGTFGELEAIHRQSYVDVDGVVRPLLNEDELRFLMIDKGNLDVRERREIESHVTHTYRFLQQIPWTRELRGIPDIAYGHHEKLNGMGYPRGVKERAIPVQTRMMTIADIYDALTATDRPYKRAVPVERALDILHAEAKGGLVDAHLLETFTAAQVWKRVTTSEGTTGRSGQTGTVHIP